MRRDAELARHGGCAETLCHQDQDLHLPDRELRGQVESGELRSDTNPDRLIDLLMGTITMPLLFFQDVPTPDEPQAIVDQVLSGYSAHDLVPRR